MNEITYSEYWSQLNSMAEDLIEEAKELYDEPVEDAIRDNGLDHEAVDGHQWMIYNYYHDFILKHTDNYDAIDEIYTAEDMGNIAKESGLESLKAAYAFFAMYQDFQEVLQTKLEELEEA